MLNCTHPVSGSLLSGSFVTASALDGVIVIVGETFVCSPPVFATGIRVRVMVVVRYTRSATVGVGTFVGVGGMFVGLVQ